MKSVLPVVRGCLGRWFPGARTGVAFALPLVVFTVYAILSSEGLYHLEIKLTADREADVRVSYDPGTGFTKENSVQARVPASTAPVAMDFPIPVDRIRALQISCADAPVVMRLEAVTIRTNFKIWMRPRSYRPLDFATSRTETKGETSPRTGESARLLVATKGGPAPVCTIIPRVPVRIGLAWVYLGYRWVGFALGWLLLWVGTAEAGRRWGWLAAGRSPADGTHGFGNWRGLGPTITRLADKLPGTTSSPAVTLLRRWAGSVSMLGLFLGVAFRRAWLSTHDLNWPYDIDLYRDTTFAHSILAGKFPADAYYLGEQNWYNPLSSFVAAVVATLFSTDPAHVYARFGAYVGLGVPLAIFLLGTVLFGRWAALCALFAFLFLRTPNPPWATPTYSPWIFANILSLVPMAACIALAVRARTSPRLTLWTACGAALGVTFLAHTAAAMIAGSVSVALACTRDKLLALRRCAVLVVVAFVASLPFAMSILLHYKLRVRNNAAQVWLFEETALDHLRPLLVGSLTVANAIAVWGGVALWRRPSLAGPRRALFTWLGVAGFLLAYSFAKQAVPAWPLPGFVPPYHWLFQLRVVRTLFFGFGLYQALEAITVWMRPWLKLRPSVAVCATLLTLLAWNYERYAGLFDFAGERAASRAFDNPAFTETIDWLRQHTPAEAVILTEPTNAVVMLGAAYRQAVVIDRNFSNPYVPYEGRAEAAAAMNEALANADEDTFRANAARYGAGYVLLNDVTSADDPRLAAPFVTVAFRRDPYAVLQVKP